jgi:uncharacterized protein
MKARFSVKVQPRARKTEVDGKLGDSFKLRLAAPPVDGKANEECVRFLAELFGVARAAVRIVSGLTARIKIVEIDGVDPASVERRLLG